MASLAEIVHLDGSILIDEFGLEPHIRCSPSESDNLLHLSPIVLLDDKELREGGFQDRGAKDVLSRVAKHICDSEDPSLFQVPEITDFHMGYAKRSGNKASRMAIDEEESKVWMTYMNLSRLNQDQSLNPDSDDEEPRDSTSSIGEINITRPTAKDTQNVDDEDVVSPLKSGLKFPIKGSLILLFSILLIFFDKKKKKKKSSSSNDEEPCIGPNKVSDFLLFWIIPFLLNYTHRKVREITMYHQERNKLDCPTVSKKSTFDVIEDAMSSCRISEKVRASIMRKYTDFYGSEALEYKYDLLKSPEGTPVILVPKDYKVTQMPLELEDIGTKWRQLGDTNLLQLFVSKFIRSKKIQRDFFDSLKHAKNRQGIDYSIILPDQKTFNELKASLDSESCDYLIAPKVGRNPITRLGLVTTTDKHLRVCFTYLQGSAGKDVAALFRAIGAHYLDHFSLIVLHGFSLNISDSDCTIGSLYPVSIPRKVTFRGNSVQVVKKKKKSDSKNTGKKDFSAGQGRFCRAEFPKTYKLWEDTIRKDDVVDNLISRAKARLGFDPCFECDKLLHVAYTREYHSKKLKEVPFGASMAPDKEALSKYQIRAVNLDGSFLSNIVRSGRKENIAVVLAIKDVCGKVGCGFSNLSQAIQSIIVNFVRAAVVAGLPKVYPSEPDKEDRIEIESGSSEDEDESSYEEPCASGQNVAGNAEEMQQESEGKRHSARKRVADPAEDPDQCTSNVNSSYISGKRQKVADVETEEKDNEDQSNPHVKQGTPSDYELECLASELGDVWKKLGRRLKIQDPKLDDLNKLNEDLSEKGYKMLRHWKEVNGSVATYQILGDALQHKLVNQRELSEKFCYKKQ